MQHQQAELQQSQGIWESEGKGLI